MTHRACLFLCLLLLLATPALAEDDEDEGEPLDGSTYPESLTGPRLFAYSSFHVMFGYDYFDDGQFMVSTIGLNPGGSIGLLDGKLSIDLDIWMDIVMEDKSGFVFQAFGTGVNYMVYNKAPVAITSGIHFKLINQSFDNVAGADVFYLRPYTAVGIGVWRFFFTPYLGIPVYIDTNNGNDPTVAALNSHDPNNKRIFPSRRPNYWMDDNPFGIDYGVPISFMVVESFFITVEPAGLTWLYPEPDTTIWITPGVLYRGGSFQVGAGVRVRLYPEDSPERRWAIVANAGMVF